MIVVREATTPEERFAAQVAAQAALIDRLPDEAVRAMLTALEQARQMVLAELAVLDPASYASFRLAQTQAGITDVMARFVEQYQSAVSPAQLAMWDAGAGLAAEPLVRAGLMFHVPIPSRRLLEAARAYQASLITGLAGDAITQISTALRAGVLRGQSVYEVMQAVAGSLAGPSVFASIAQRAETITRTELGRVQSIANQAALEDAKGFVPDLQKQWQHSGNMGRWRREGHVEAEGQIREPDARYRVRPQPGQPYEDLLYPRDPAGSARSTIGCGCLSAPYRAAWADVLRLEAA
ncbi:MAG TPA: hypothetical protein VKA83_09450 [Methylomirabilota bacterium]|nr:hypothetical protein [Methylomirabilota bacterium]